MSNDIMNLNVPITFFTDLKQMEVELGLTGMNETDRKFLISEFKGIAWQETLDGKIVMFPNVVNFLRENTPMFNS